MGNPAYKILNKSIVDCVVTSDSCLQSTLSLLFQQLSCGWAWSAFNIPVNLHRDAGDFYSLLLEEILRSALPPQTALCFDVSTMAKFVVTLQHLCKIIRGFMSDVSDAQTPVSVLRRHTQRYLPTPQGKTQSTHSVAHCCSVKMMLTDRQRGNSWLLTASSLRASTIL